MRPSMTRAGLIATAAAGLVLGLSACGSDSDGDPGSGAGDSEAAGQEGVVGVVEEDPGDGSPRTTIDAGEGDYAFGVGRDSIAEAVAQTYSSQNATAEWEGDTLVVTMDGDTEGPMAGWSECRVVTELVEEGDAVAFVFPSGRLECAEVLGG